MVYSTYIEVQDYRKKHINEVAGNHTELNHFHDELYKDVIEISIKRITEHLGPPPSPFTFFVMGSAGRFEQAIWSDQDHGILFEKNIPEAQSYFLKLGKEISDGLHQVGYSYCDGGVMASNPLWCKSRQEWEQQLSNWMTECSWETIRQLLIFIDARALYGNQADIEWLKNHIYQAPNKSQLLLRMKNNTMLVKKGVGVFGQLLVETHGIHSGTINLKEKAFFPYVNAVRLLAIRENILNSSTLSRLENISLPVETYQDHFNRLLDFRLKLVDHTNYEDGHYLLVNKLSREQKKDLKDILKYGVDLYHYTCKLIDEGSYGNE